MGRRVFESEALERLNFAPHSSVTDVRDTPDGFRPVLSALTYPDNLAELIRIQHAAFEYACELLRTIAAADMGKMLKVDPIPVIAATYRRMSGSRSELKCLHLTRCMRLKF